MMAKDRRIFSGMVNHPYTIARRLGGARYLALVEESESNLASFERKTAVRPFLGCRIRRTLMLLVLLLTTSWREGDGSGTHIHIVPIYRSGRDFHEHEHELGAVNYRISILASACYELR